MPMVEPEVLMDGAHEIDRAQQVTEVTLREVFAELRGQRVLLSGMVLKPNMVLSGSDCPEQAGVHEVVKRTLELFGRVVPTEVPGIAFLSGGQSDKRASAHLSAMNAIGGAHGSSASPTGGRCRPRRSPFGRARSATPAPPSSRLPIDASAGGRTNRVIPMDRAQVFNCDLTIPPIPSISATE